MRRLELPRLVAGLTLLTGCHTEPFTPPQTGTTRPFDPGPPVRITANTGSDDQISFSPDGRYLIYSVSRSCIAFLPVHQARDSVWLCPEPAGQNYGYSHAALSSSRRLGFIVTQQSPLYRAVVTAPLADLRDTAEVIPVPFVSVVDGVLHQEVTALVWLRGDTLALLADGIVYLTDPDSPVFPRAFERLPLPGLAYDLQPSRDGSLLYLRVVGDTRVLAWNPATASLTVVYDFGTEPAGHVAVGRTHLVAALPGAILRIRLDDRAADTVPTLGLAITELAVAPDGSDILASALDPRLPPPPRPVSSDLYRFNP